jgi:putative transposase
MAHKGTQKAVQGSFIGAPWQMCHVHFIRAVLKNIPNNHKEEMAEKVKYALGNEQAVQILSDGLDKRRLSKALDAIERSRYDLWG